MAMRAPVTRMRRCEQITAFGAPEVPDVNTSTQRVSGSWSRPGSSSPTSASASSRSSEPPDAEVEVDVEKRCDTRTAPVAEVDAGQAVDAVRLGDHEVDVGVVDVAGQVLPHPRGVQADHRRAGEGRAGRARTGSPACCPAARRRGAVSRPRRAGPPAARGRGWPSEPPRPPAPRGSTPRRRSGWPDGRPCPPTSRCGAAAPPRRARASGPDRAEGRCGPRRHITDARVRSARPRG